MVTKSQLVEALDGLITKADEQNRLHESSRQTLYLTLGHAYVWWSEAKGISGFLDELYEDRKLIARGKEENFTRLIRLIWQKDWSGRQAPTLQLWSKAFRKIHQEVDANRDAYRKDTAERIREYLDSGGGIKGILDIQPRVEEEYIFTKKTKNKNFSLKDEEIKNKHFELGQQYFGNTNSYLLSLISEKQKLTVSKNGYAVALIKKNGKNTNSYKILSISKNDEILKDLIVDTYKRSSENTPYALKLICETIQAQALPLAFEKNRNSIIGTSTITNSDGEKFKQYKQLIIRTKKKDILLSEVRNDCSVVTHVKPKESLINDSNDVYLRISDQRYLEHEVIQKNDLAFHTILNENVKKITNKDIVADYKIETKNTVTQARRNIYFYKQLEEKNSINFQADINEEYKYKPLWSALVNKDWISELEIHFTSNWLREYGSQINRPHHKQIRIDLTKKSFKIAYYGIRNNYVNIEDKIPMPNIKSTSKNLSIQLIAKDILPIFNALAKIEIIGNVEVSANEELLRFEYKTELATYTTFVPTSENQNKLIKKAFTTYGI